jgi:hypothetical protein
MWSIWQAGCRVPAVYLTSAEEAISAFLPFIEINNLRLLKAGS